MEHVSSVGVAPAGRQPGPQDVEAVAEAERVPSELFLADIPECLTCPVCNEVPLGGRRCPKGCGRVFCEGCVLHHFAIHTTCPACQTGLSSFEMNTGRGQMFHALLSHYFMSCPNSKWGCRYQGKSGEVLENHWKECRYQVQACPESAVDCDWVGLTKDYEEHMKTGCKGIWSDCPHCHRTMRQDILTAHIPDCRWLPPPQPQQPSPPSSDAGGSSSSSASDTHSDSYSDSDSGSDSNSGSDSESESDSDSDTETDTRDTDTDSRAAGSDPCTDSDFEFGNTQAPREPPLLPPGGHPLPPLYWGRGGKVPLPHPGVVKGLTP